MHPAPGAVVSRGREGARDGLLIIRYLYSGAQRGGCNPRRGAVGPPRADGGGRPPVFAAAGRRGAPTVLLRGAARPPSAGRRWATKGAGAAARGGAAAAAAAASGGASAPSGDRVALGEELLDVHQGGT